MTFAVGACAPFSSNGPDTDAWGNPLPNGDDDSCVVPSGAPINPDLFRPDMHQRPADVLPGNRWIVFEYEARALPQVNPGAAGGYEYCVPIDVHVYVRPGEADVVARGVDSFSAGPFDFTTTTPWLGRYIVLQYDPTNERFEGRPPSYELHLQVKYAGDRDAFHAAADEPSALSCRLKVDGAGVVSDLAVMPGRDNVECTYIGDLFHSY